MDKQIERSHHWHVSLRARIVMLEEICPFRESIPFTLTDTQTEARHGEGAA